MSDTISLTFPLEVDDDWPPVGAECLPFAIVANGFRALSAPLFVRDLSVDDVIDAALDNENRVESWEHVVRAPRTVVWLARLRRPNELDIVLDRLRAMGCNTVSLDSVGCYAVDVPAEVPIADVDSVLASLDEETVAVAFPSMRHPEAEE